jgi:glutamate N-acetyltransferase/amino-acid N-acetyltransferase
MGGDGAMADKFSLDADAAEICHVDGFRTGAASCGLAREGSDVGVIVCEEVHGTGTAVFTRNALRAAPVQVSSPRGASGRLRAAVVNAGNANCFTGDEGLEIARQMISVAASDLDVPAEQVLVASAGEAGFPLDMDKVQEGIEGACKDAGAGGEGDFASVILAAGGSGAQATRRIASASGTIGGKSFRIAGAAKGASLLSPAMANCFAFVVSDAAVGAECLREVASSAFERTFGLLSIDGEAITNDTFCVLCSGRAGNEPIEDVLSAGVFAKALEAVVRRLAFDLAFGEEVSNRLVRVRTSGASDSAQAEAVARAVAGSLLVRTALHAGEARWGRILAATGRSGARVVGSRLTLRLEGTTVYDRGAPLEETPKELAMKLASAAPVTVEIDLGLGEGAAEMWTSTLSDGDEDRLRRLKKQRDEAVAERDELETRVGELEAAEASATKKSEAATAEAGKHEEELTELRAKVEDLTEKLNDATWEQATAERTVKKLRRQLEGEDD